MKHTFLCGTYTEKGSEGIYRFVFEDGKVSASDLFCRISDPKYISVQNGLVATAASFAEGCGIAVLDRDGNILDRAVFEDQPSCYVSWHDDRIYCANYHAGHFTVLSWQNGKLAVIRTVTIREKAGCHQVIFHSDRILVPCLLLDEVRMFSYDLEPLGTISFLKGTGPRHGVFRKDGSVLYLTSELSNELFMIDTGSWTVRKSVSVLPEGKMHLTDGAAIRMSANEKTVYVSTRTENIITAADAETLAVKQIISCGGDHPRDIYRFENWLLSANRFTNDVCVFAVLEDGTLQDTGSRTEVIQGVSLAVLD